MILKKKLKLDGMFYKFKARLIDKSFWQSENIGFFYTFSPNTIIAATRLPIPLSFIWDLLIHKMNVETNFLNSELEE